MTLQIAQFIKDHGLAALTEQFGITVGDYPDYVVLNYSQIDSPKHNPMVDECRALILDRHTLQPLARGFDRFYNHGEDQRSKEFPFTQAIALEKVDGSLILIWWNPYLNRWNASTRKMAHAEGTTSFGSSYHDLVVKALSGQSLDTVFGDFQKDRTFIFELVSPESRVVTPYPDYALYALCVRETVSGIEHPEEVAAVAEAISDSLPDGSAPVRVPRLFKFGSIEAALKAADALPAMEEGYVWYTNTDSGIWRLKVKNPAYLAIAHLRNNGDLSLGRVARLVLMGDEEEYLSYFEEDRKFFQPYIDARDLMWKDLEKVWEENQGIESQKDFALKVKGYPFAHILFARRKGQATEDILDKMTTPSKERLMEGAVSHYQTRE
jgi:hypothetical protein